MENKTAYDVYLEIIETTNKIEDYIANGYGLIKFRGKVSEEFLSDPSKPTPILLKEGRYFAKSVPKDGIGTLDVVDCNGKPVFKLKNDGKFKIISGENFNVELHSDYEIKFDCDLEYLENVKAKVEDFLKIVEACIIWFL